MFRLRLLLVGLLSELLLMRIPLRYHSGQNAVTFVSFYYLFCQNAIFRGISLLEAALVIPLCGVMLREAASPFSDYSSIMIYAAFMLLTGAVFVVLIVIGPGSDRYHTIFISFCMILPVRSEIVISHTDRSPQTFCQRR